MIEKNIEAFLKMEKELIRKHHGKIAVFSKGNLILVEKDLRKALEKAKKTKEKTLFIAELYTPEEQAAGIL
jgi:hypothetical protein